MFWPRGIGLMLARVYLIAATWVVQDELRHTGGGWINLRGIGTKLLTAPSQATAGSLPGAIGVRAVDFNNPGPAGYLEPPFTSSSPRRSSTGSAMGSRG